MTVFGQGPKNFGILENLSVIVLKIVFAYAKNF